MKSKLSLMWRVALTLALVASLAMVFSPAPITAQEPDPDGVSVTITECPEGIITPCTNFGVKATLTSSGTNTGVVATLGISAHASLVAGMSDNWTVGDMAPGDVEEVGWTLHCDGPGDVRITITTNRGGSAYCDVRQQEPAELEATVDAPCEICTNCSPDNKFTVDATISNTGDIGVHDVWATISSSGAGTVTITPPLSKFVGSIAAGGHGHVSWDVTCLGPGDVTFSVSAQGIEDYTGNTVNTAAPGTDTTHQKDVIVKVTSIEGVGCPPDGDLTETVSTQQKFTVTALVSNCTISPMPIHVILDKGGALDAVANLTDKVHVVPKVGSPYDIDPPVWEVELANVCGCCTYEITWTLVCTGPGGPIDVAVVAEKPDETQLDSNLDCQTVTLTQEAKVHLKTTLEARVEDCVSGWQKVDAVTVGQYFRIRVAVQNTGGADALDVKVPLLITGPTTCAGPGGLDFGTVPGGHTSVGLIGCVCLEEGVVEVVVDPAVGITGKDENTCQAILAANIEAVCPLVVQQVPFKVEIIQPINLENFCVSDDFTVKAKLTNYSTTVELKDLDVTLLFDDTRVELNTGQPNPVEIETIARAVSAEPVVHEVTWQMHCKAPGDVTFHVCVESATGTYPPPPPTPPVKLQVTDINDPAVTIHQWPSGTANISMEILSPDSMNTLIATSQDFALTAVITNNSLYPITIDTVGFIANPGDAISVVPPAPQVGEIQPGGSQNITWTLHCEKSGVVEISAHVTGHYGPCVTAEASTTPIYVLQYPAAHLEVQITGFPEGPVTACTEFPLAVTITNTGEADATEVSATLSVTPEGSVAVAAGGEGFTKYFGTLPRHSSTTKTWNLHCKEACESTITVTATGNDEYGFHKKQECQSTGNFLMEEGGVMKYGWCDPFSGYEDGSFEFYGTSSGLTGPFNLEAEVSYNWGPEPIVPPGNICCSGRLSMMGYIDPAQGIMEGMYLIKDAKPCVPIEPPPQIPCVGWGPIYIYEGLFNVVNGMWNGYFEGYYMDYPIRVAITNGKFCSVMAAEPGRAIDATFIEPDSVTVKQVAPPADANLSITKDANPSGNITVGQTVTFTVTLYNLGPAKATSIKVTDLLPSGVNYQSSGSSQGWYDVTSGVWDVGDLAYPGSAWLQIITRVNTVGSITNRATITAAVQHDPDTTNNSAVVSITGQAPLPVTQWTINVYTGYNLVSLPLIPDNPAINTMTAPLEPNLVKIYRWEALVSPRVWLVYNPAMPFPEGSTLYTMEDGWGYWVKMTAADYFTFTGSELVASPEQLPPSYFVVEGWNLIGFKSTRPKTPADYLAAIAGKYVMIYGYANGRFFIAGAPGHEYLEPGLGYWIALKDGESGTIYP